MKKQESIGIRIFMLGILVNMPSIFLGQSRTDSVAFERIFDYQRNFADHQHGIERQIYVKYLFDVEKRNPTLLAVPSLYRIAKGARRYVGESFGRITINNSGDFVIDQQAEVCTIPHHSKVMKILAAYIMPDVYGITLYGGNVLSPFHRSNRRFYVYQLKQVGDNTCVLTFRPKVNNTQMVRGFALVDNLTGRIATASIRGEYDMLKFDTYVDMGDRNNTTSVPARSVTKARFAFLGNKLTSTLTSIFDDKEPERDTQTDKDSLGKNDIRLMDQLRPYPLTQQENTTYLDYLSDNSSDGKTRKSPFTQRAWDTLEDYAFSRMGMEGSNASVTMSPLLNPLYFSYSNRRGLAYRIEMGAEYKLSDNSRISINPHVGYNFKIRQFYYGIPLRYTFNARRNGWIEIETANGNRITDSSVLNILQSQYRDTIDFSRLGLDYFNDNAYKLTANMRMARKLECTLALISHKRTAVNREMMELVGKPYTYRSFAPSLTLSYQPTPKWPVISFNYERSIKGILDANLAYERMETDVSYKRKLHSLRTINLRTGGGFYSNRSTSYFVDFTNFHENYLPEGWNDDWAGEFQLLNSDWYNASRYYFRANASYESPLLLARWIPLIGKHFESEQLYASFLVLENTNPYWELGYGITTRFLSIGLFTSMLNMKMNEVGCKFTIELFRKW